MTDEDGDQESAKELKDVVTLLNYNYTTLSESLETWLNKLPAAEALNLGAKHANLKNKLRWEKLMSSGEKVKKLQNIFKKIRGKK